MISIEPNHEHEIAIAVDETTGDYNPAIIRGFTVYLQPMTGLDEAGERHKGGITVDVLR